MNGSTIFGQEIKVNVARPKEEGGGGGFGGDRRGGYGGGGYNGGGRGGGRGYGKRIQDFRCFSLSIFLKEEEVVEVETVDTVEAEAVVATEDVVDMITAAGITITTGMEETDTMGEAEAEVVAMVMRNNINLEGILYHNLY